MMKERGEEEEEEEKEKARRKEEGQTRRHGPKGKGRKIRRGHPDLFSMFFNTW